MILRVHSCEHTRLNGNITKLRALGSISLRQPECNLAAGAAQQLCVRHVTPDDRVNSRLQLRHARRRHPRRKSRRAAAAELARKARERRPCAVCPRSLRRVAAAAAAAAAADAAAIRCGARRGTLDDRQCVPACRLALLKRQSVVADRSPPQAESPPSL